MRRGWTMALSIALSLVLLALSLLSCAGATESPRADDALPPVHTLREGRMHHLAWLRLHSASASQEEWRGRKYGRFEGLIPFTAVSVARDGSIEHCGAWPPHISIHSTDFYVSHPHQAPPYTV